MKLRLDIIIVLLSSINKIASRANPVVINNSETINFDGGKNKLIISDKETFELNSSLKIKVFSDEVRLEESSFLSSKIKVLKFEKRPKGTTDGKFIESESEFITNKYEECKTNAASFSGVKVYLCFYLNSKDDLDSNEICFGHQEIIYMFNFYWGIHSKDSSTRTFEGENAKLNIDCSGSIKWINLEKPIIPDYPQKQTYNTLQYSKSVLSNVDYAALTKVWADLQIGTQKGNNCLTGNKTLKLKRKY
jgi:hypothetical protein